MSDFDHQTTLGAFLVVALGFEAMTLVTLAVYVLPRIPLLGAAMMFAGLAVFLVYLGKLLDYVTPQIGESHRDR